MIGLKSKHVSQVMYQAQMSQQRVQGLLVNVPKRYYEMQRLHVQDNGGRNSYSGIKMTMFGPTSPLGEVIGGMMTRMGSTAIYPYRHLATTYDWKLKELRTTADLGYKAFIKLTDFTSEKEIAYTLRDSNTVISCIGSRIYAKKDKDFEDANINIPVTIAKAVKKNPRVKRLIMFSAAGADPNSHSRRLRTKWLGE